MGVFHNWSGQMIFKNLNKTGFPTTFKFKNMKYTLNDDFGNTKEVTKEQQGKILSMDVDVQSFFLRCNDFDLLKKYPVADFETEFTGMDILVMMHKMKEIEKSPTAGMTYNHPFYFNHSGNACGYMGCNGYASL